LGNVPEAWAVVVAGGSGQRFGALKQYAELGGRSLLSWSVGTARRACAGVVAVVPDPGDPRALEAGADATVAGGTTRSASVRAGLAAVPPSAGIVVVHDAARPLVEEETWAAVIAAVAAGADAAIPVVAVTDTIKQVADDGTLLTLDRSRLVAVQTPQAFAAGALRRAHAGGTDATDDAALVEALGGHVARVPGHGRNLKVTDPADLVVAEALLRAAARP
jgi:2-C-methyl-D-erythritol 4-phosphate cytidylyltransferase